MKKCLCKQKVKLRLYRSSWMEGQSWEKRLGEASALGYHKSRLRVPLSRSGSRDLVSTQFPTSPPPTNAEHLKLNSCRGEIFNYNPLISPPFLSPNHQHLDTFAHRYIMASSHTQRRYLALLGLLANSLFSLARLKDAINSIDQDTVEHWQ